MSHTNMNCFFHQPSFYSAFYFAFSLRVALLGTRPQSNLDTPAFNHPRIC